MILDEIIYIKHWLPGPSILSLLDIENIVIIVFTEKGRWGQKQNCYKKCFKAYNVHGSLTLRHKITPDRLTRC